MTVKRMITLVLLVSVLLGACVPTGTIFVYPPTATVPAAVATQPAVTSAATAVATPVPEPTTATTAAEATTVPAATPTAALAAQMTPPATPMTDTLASHQWQLNEQLPLAPDVVSGKLSNGLTYLIRRNSTPKNRAELHLVVNAGSVLEDDDQQGLAHFLEHMMFNGTCRFPKQAIQTFLESNGMRFGADLNASTGFDETEYVLRIPLDDPKVLDTALNVLQDWASCATLDPAQMDRERGVIEDEYRLREQSAQGRISDKLITTLLAGSQYAKRLPIGQMSIVQNASMDTLRRFYTTWYRPDLMAVIAVGDFDASQVEQAIQQKFGTIPARTDERPRPTFTVPDFTSTRYLIATDPENTTTSIQAYVKTPAPSFGTVALYRQALVQNLFFNMLNERLTELVQGGNAPFTAADSGQTQLVHTADANILEAQLQEQDIVPALDSLMTEVERVRRFGFTAPELQRAQSTLLEGYRTSYDGRNTRDTSNVAAELIRHFLTGEDVPGIEIENQIANQFVPQITLQEVNQQVQGLATAGNRLVAVLAPEKTGFTPPTTQQLESTVAGVAAKDIKPYVAQAAAAQLMTDIPPAAAVVSQTTISELNVTEITLANGLRVIMKPTNFSADQVLFTGIAPGGASLLPDSEVPAARFISGVVANSGVGPFNKTQLDALLAGKTVNVRPDIRELTQRIDGSASPRDLETALQLVYLYVTQPRVDPNAVKAAQDAARADLANRALSPDSALQDTIISLLYGDSIRRLPYIPLADIQAIDINRAFQIYKDRFGDMGGFTFVFVGNFDVAQVTALAQKYLGNLPSHGRVDAWADKLPGPLPGVHQQDIYKGNDNRSITAIIFPGPLADSPDSDLRLKLVGDILNLELTAQLRLKLGASYSPSVDTGVEHWPHPNYQLAITFTTAPTLTQELLDATWQQIDVLRTDGPSATDVATAKEQELRSNQDAVQQNSFWRDTLVNYTLDPQHQDPRTPLHISAMLDKITAQDVQQAAQQFLNKQQYVQVVLYPAASQPVTGTQTLLPADTASLLALTQ